MRNDPSEQLPPHDVAAEQCLLASCMLSAASFADVRRGVVDESFYLDEHRHVWRALVAMYDTGAPVDAVTLRARLKADGTLDDVGGTAYIAELLGSVPNAAHAAAYAKQVADTARRRHILQVAYDAIASASDPTQDAADVAGKVAKAMQDGAAIGRASRTRSIADIGQDVLATLEAGNTGLIETPWPMLTKALGGFGRSEFVVVAGRPSMGKSLVLRQIAFHAARHVGTTLLVSLEEGSQKVFRNWAAGQLRIENNRLRHGRMTLDEQKLLRAFVTTEARDVPMFISDARTPDAIEAEVAAMAMAGGLQMICIDYLTLIQAKGQGQYDKATEASKFVAGLRKFDVPIVVAAQLSRSNTHRDDHRPVLTDLRDSGQIEQDADVVLGVHREDYYHLADRSYVPTGVAELICLKQKDGNAIGKTVHLGADLKHQMLVESPRLNHLNAPELLVA